MPVSRSISIQYKYVFRDFRLYAKEFGDLIYRVEKCDSFNTMGYYFTNLTRIMENSVKG